MIDTVPALIGTAITAVGIGFLLKGRATAHWCLVTGTVVEVAIETSRNQFGSKPDLEFYEARLHYKYVFKGVVRRGSRGLGGRVTSRANAVDLGRRYAAGQAIDVFVNEQKPDRHALERGVNHQYWWLVVFGVAWMAFAFR